MTELYLPPEQRVEILREYARTWALRYFVETGTAEAFTTRRLVADFEMIHTIEVDVELHRRAVELFANYGHVLCWRGDSAEKLSMILEMLPGPALFWIDGHWTNHGHNPAGPDTPIRDELPLVMAHTLTHQHVVLVDDARLFREGVAWESEEYDWPSLTWVREQAESYGYRYELVDDVIRLTPP
jgi:hypothetical protein